jgi:hypothetical protein
LWAALFVSLIVGGAFYVLRSWQRATPSNEVRLDSLPRIEFVTFTPSAHITALPTGQATIGMATPAQEITPAQAVATLVPTATPAPLPTSTSTTAPTELPAQAPQVVVAPTAVATATPPASTVITPGEELAHVCATVVDEFFLTAVAALTGEMFTEFSCPSAPAHLVPGEWMPFEHGTMVATAGSPLVYVYYASNGEWEQVVGADANEPADVVSPVENGEVAPPAPFAPIWLAEGRRFQLGEALQTEPLRSETIVQPFDGGVLLGSRSDGAILLLARSKLRF